MEFKLATDPEAELLKEMIVYLPGHSITGDLKIKAEYANIFSMASLNSFVTTITAPIHYIAAEESFLEKLPAQKFRISAELASENLHVAIIKIYPDATSLTYEYFTIYSGNPMALTLFKRRQVAKKGSDLWHDEVVQKALQDSVHQSIIVPMVAAREIKVYVGTFRLVYHILVDPDISQESKVFTMQYTLFPHVRPWIGEVAYLIPLSTYLQEKGIIETPEPEEEDPATTKHYIMCSVLYTLGPSFSIEVNITKQLTARAAAACAPAQLPPPDESDFKVLLSSTGWKCTGNTPRVDELLGHVLCLNKDNEFQITVTLENLLPLSEYTYHHVVNPWVVAVLAQMRMLYDHFRATSIMFGINLLPSFRAIFCSLGVDWANEVTNFEAIIEEVRSQLYRFMVVTTPEKFQIKQYARIIYLAVLVYQRNLSTEAEKLAFKDYNTDGIKAHIKSSQDVQTIITASSIIIPQRLAMICKFLTTLSIESGEQLYSGLSKTEMAQVNATLLASSSRGSWLNQYKAKSISQAKAKLREYAQKAMLQKLDLGKQACDVAIDATQDPALMMEKRRRKSEWVQEMHQLIDSLEDSSSDMEHLIEPSLEKELAEFKAQAVSAMKAILNHPFSANRTQ